MKDLFPGYYRKTDEEIKRIWENGVIMFDANVLLNLYRYSDSTQNEILSLIKKFSGQIYLPHQAALEYNRNRYEVISEQEKAYNEFLDKITQIQKDLQSTSKPPFLTSKVDKELNNVFEKVTTEVKESSTKYCDYLNNDPIYNSISDLFKNRITEHFTQDELNAIYKEGEDRYKSKIPPGFEDEKTKEGSNRYGDLILWKQIMRKAREIKKDIILITDERKIDWWWKIKNGKIMGPRQELVEEIKADSGIDFHMYSSERFLTYGQSFRNGEINQRAINEIQAMKKAEIEDMNRLQFLEKRKFAVKLKVNEELNILYKKLEEINDKISYFRSHQEPLFNEHFLTNEKMEHANKLVKIISELAEEKTEVQSKINSINDILTESINENSDSIRFKNYYNFNKPEKG
jgi:hypothetical protein